MQQSIWQILEINMTNNETEVNKEKKRCNLTGDKALGNMANESH